MRVFILLFLLISSNFIISQNCDNTITGKVLDLHDNTILVDARIVVLEINKQLLTNESGEFTISGLCNQTYTIEISHAFCLPKTYKIELISSIEKVFSFRTSFRRIK